MYYTPKKLISSCMNPYIKALNNLYLIYPHIIILKENEIYYNNPFVLTKEQTIIIKSFEYDLEKLRVIFNKLDPFFKKFPLPVEYPNIIRNIMDIPEIPYERYYAAFIQRNFSTEYIIEINSILNELEYYVLLKDLYK